MKKTINKIAYLFSLGLLFLAVSIPCAHATRDITRQDAWEFLGKNAADGGSQFKSDYKKSDLKSKEVVCGKRKCNIEEKVCLEKKVQGKDPSYICAKKGEADRYIKMGYSIIAGSKTSSSSNKEEKCYKAKAGQSTDSKVTKYCIQATATEINVKAGSEDKKRTCPVIEVTWYNSRNCIFCPMVGVIYAVADKVTVISQKAFARSFAIVAAVGLLVWVAFKTLAFVSDLTKRDIAKYINELLTQSFKFLIVFFALLYYREVFDWLILPLIRAGMDFGSSFVNVETLASRFGAETLNLIIKAGSTGDATLLQGVSGIPVDYVRNASNKFFDLYTYASMENLAYNVNLQYSLLQTIGRSLICSGFYIMSGNFFSGFGLGIACIIYGICFGAFGFLLSIAFVFYLLDAVVIMGVVGSLLPFLIACWPFKITSKYTKTGFNLLLNSIFVFIMMGVVVNLSVELIRAAVEFNTSGGSSNDQNGLSELAIALSELDTVKLERLVNILSIGFILFIVANMMSLLFVKKVKDFASKFADGINLGIAETGAGLVASKAYGASKKAVGGVISSNAKQFSDSFSGATEELKEDILDVKDNVKKKVGNVINKAGSYVGSKMRKVPVIKSVMSFNDKVQQAGRVRIAQNQRKDSANSANKASIKNILN